MRTSPDRGGRRLLCRLCRDTVRQSGELSDSQGMACLHGDSCGWMAVACKGRRSAVGGRRSVGEDRLERLYGTALRDQDGEPCRVQSVLTAVSRRIFASIPRVFSSSRANVSTRWRISSSASRAASSESVCSEVLTSTGERAPLHSAVLSTTLAQFQRFMRMPRGYIAKASGGLAGRSQVSTSKRRSSPGTPV